MGFMNRIMQFLQGRYKNDQLNIALLIAGCILMLLNRIFLIWRFVKPMYITALIFYVLSLLCLIFFAFRFLSKNIYKRSYENRIFLNIWNHLKDFFVLQKRKFTDRKTHRYIKCPYCKAQLRVKKRRGKHKVRCPKCNAEFEKNFIL